MAKRQPSSDPLPYYKWFVRHHRANRKAQRLSYIERGLLRELLDEQWEEGAIPDEISKLAEICDCPVGVMAEAWPNIKPFFPVLATAGEYWLANRKLEALRTKEDATRAQRSMAGTAGAKRKQMSANASKCQQMPYIREEKRREEAFAGDCPSCGQSDGVHSIKCIIGKMVRVGNGEEG